MRDVGATRALLLRLVLPKRLVSSHVANNEEKCPRIPCTWKEGLGMDRSDSRTRGFGRKWELFVPPRFNGVPPLHVEETTCSMSVPEERVWKYRDETGLPVRLRGKWK
jgi:hypothetical protein